MRFYPAISLLTALALIYVCVADSARAQGFDDPGAGGGKAGDVVAVEPKVDGGAVALGSASQVVVLFRNDDIKPLNLTEISLYPSSNVSASVGENQCALEGLAPASVCAVAINVKGLRPGKYRIEMLVKHDGRSKLLTATVTGDIESSEGVQELISDIETIPAEIDFGTLNASSQQVKSVILRNTTSGSIDISEVVVQSVSQSGFSMESDCTKLETGQACLASITWAPSQKGPATGTLLVRHSGPTGIASVPLKGSYEPAASVAAEIYPEAVPGRGLLVSSLDTVDFGATVDSTASITVSLVNVGDSPLTIKGTKLANKENGVEVAGGGCKPGTVLDPIAACPLTLTWQPSREGAIVDDVQVFHDGARGVLVIPVRGTATETVNKDSKSMLLGADGNAILRTIPALSSADVGDDGDSVSSDSKSSKSKQTSARKVVDVDGILDPYTITSKGPGRAVISGPGGSRVVFDGDETVIGGVLWTVVMRQSAIEFTHEGQKVLMLFDRSLTGSSSSVNQSGSQSSGTSSTSGGENSAAPVTGGTTTN
ncbi:MAG: choice-of-anchor D domain-containing protein [Alphaproteobacteria bacterium]|nr:choice-of-anchor D domain-containing protein [Alphaproteobacteria bacterium]